MLRIAFRRPLLRIVPSLVAMMPMRGNSFLPGGFGGSFSAGLDDAGDGKIGEFFADGIERRRGGRVAADDDVFGSCGRR